MSDPAGDVPVTGSSVDETDAVGDLRYYLVWPTRRRKRFLEGPLLTRAEELFAEAARGIGAQVVAARSGGDYVVVTVEAPPHLAPAVIAERLKRYSAGHLRREFPELARLPSVWTRRLLATTRADFPPDRIERFIAEQPRDERRRLTSRTGE
jgi:putative transposase